MIPVFNISVNKRVKQVFGVTLVPIRDRIRRETTEYDESIVHRISSFYNQIRVLEADFRTRLRRAK